jgi:hypothetical protein
VIAVSMRPLERFRSIRAKLGSVIVLAVALTLLVSYLVIGFALRNSPKDSEAIDALALARSAANGQLGSIPADSSIVAQSPTGTVTIQGAHFSVNPPQFTDGVPHWGVVGSPTRAFPLPTGAG